MARQGEIVYLKRKGSSGRFAGPLLALAIAGGLAVLTAIGVGSIGDGDRQRAVADRGREVMPFDLDATTHHFEPTADGLVETVLADDPSDQEQIALIRSHLDHEAQRFRQGDYGDPAQIHGDDMAGLDRLRRGFASVSVSYEPVPGGARIVFRSADRQMVEALHAWGKAQVADHGTHAASG